MRPDPSKIDLVVKELHLNDRILYFCSRASRWKLSMCKEKSHQFTQSDIAMLEDISTRCIARPTLRTARSVTRVYDRALKGAGVTITQVTLMVTMAKQRPGSVAQIAEWLDIEPSTLSRNIAKLRKVGLVEPTQSKGRSIEYRLTEKGIETLREMYPKWVATQESLEHSLGQDVLESARVSLSRLQGA